MASVFDILPGEKWLFWMTHPDDEIAIGAFIRRLTVGGCHVHMAWTHSTPIREREARCAADTLGVHQEQLHFLTAKDGSVAEEIDKWLPCFSETIAEIAPSKIVTTAFEQGHLDHDATNFMIHRCFDGPIFEIPLYHAYYTPFMQLNRFSDPQGEEIMCLTKEEVLFKKRLARMYPSQTIWNLLLLNEIANTVLLRPPRLYATERMRLQTHKDFLTPNVSDRILKRVQNCKKWKRWIRAITPYVD